MTHATGGKHPTSADIESLRRAARARDPVAMAALGARLLVGFPGDPPQTRDPAQGRQLLEEAARLGHAEACATLAAAFGSGNWGVARDGQKAFAYWKQAALNPHDHLAHYTVAEHLDFGLVGERDPHEALLWYMKASEAEPPYGPVASLRVGRAFERGEGPVSDARTGSDTVSDTGSGSATMSFGTPDPEAAFYWYSKAARHDDPEAWYRLGLLYEAGRGVPPDPLEAVACYERARNNHVPALRRLGDLALAGAGGARPDPARAFALYREARTREPEATWGVRACILLERGEGVAADPEAARQGLAGLAAAGCQSATFYLEHIFGAALDPHGTKDPEAGTWMEIARKGIPEAQHHLAYLHLFGHGVAEDPHKALELFYEAAQQGYAPSLHALAERHASGDGTPDDPVSAFEWYLKAAHAGVAAAQTRVGTILENGGLPGRCPFMGIFSPLPWYELAAGASDPGALYALGLLYAKGRWVETDPSRARELIGQAAELGHPLARAWCDGECGAGPDPQADTVGGADGTAGGGPAESPDGAREAASDGGTDPAP
ncbi:sel1 repeat family protein [Phaeovibrio sulfidiphilus]|uniref:Sel1 repeat family protein n=1 Tax=Phaeovibrio sulfidiphilus TaxID=1220600 RepID=A0A8J7CET5_9PROT|nr:tetratricopeptide repeat protein [Phaeovibrio sulfidiphilus]MBE1237789.1 sel1 repeat family protein [Phaeovibrio sulfidiphilus]